MRWLAVLLGIGTLFAFLWVGGELHRRNCINDGRYNCSVLPWDDGNQPKSSGPGRLPYGVSQSELDRLTGRSP